MTNGNIVSMSGVSYTYGSQPHAVTAVGDTVYTYDANGNMVTRGNQSIAWDMTNMPVNISDGVNTSTFVYDGDGSRVMKTEGGETIVYVNQYYEKNITTDEETSHYYMGSRQIAYRNDEGIRYVHHDHLSGTSVTTDSSGNVVATIIYFPFGGTRTVMGDLDTDKLFTGQRLDQSGLYFYNARYYDATIGRFVSADSIVQDYTNPQTLNRYSYCSNNPLRWVDPSGHDPGVAQQCAPLAGAGAVGATSVGAGAGAWIAGAAAVAVPVGLAVLVIGGMIYAIVDLFGASGEPPEPAITASVKDEFLEACMTMDWENLYAGGPLVVPPLEAGPVESINPEPPNLEPDLAHRVAEHGILEHYTKEWAKDEENSAWLNDKIDTFLDNIFDMYGDDVYGDGAYWDGTYGDSADPAAGDVSSSAYDPSSYGYPY